MPLFEISHVAPLIKAQKDEMALAITKLQCSKFGTPSLFVTVVFADTTGLETYVAGKPRQTNMIHVTFRDGAMHTQAQFDSLCIALQEIWSSAAQPSHGSHAPPELALGAVYVTGGVLAALEAGFIVPQAGKEKEWALGNMEAFKQKARGGDKDIAGLLEELQSRLRPAE
ncbi:hypothetical protein BJ875DRAFT_530670 [Amylocarpus encephaloides]|uniref:Tautomerase cis-CaaD-like domain-containing protein n=1 Tax=Amylocarpus encephaloides TaxID=45428 RepID=A0A9P7YJS3_9HELO|nr:hypothetical protein BJ875DRAFT_530670 [Amylocarpus encephaloides]